MPRTSLLTKYRDSMQELQETLIQEKKWRQDAESENRVLRKKNLEIEEQNTDFRYSAVELMSKIEEVTGENKRISERYQDVIERLEKVEELHERQIIRGDTLEKELDKMEENASQFREELSEKQRLVQDLSNSLQAMEEQVKILENDNFQIREEAIICEKMYKECEYELKVKQKECKELYDNFKIIDQENNNFRQQEAWILENQKLLENKTSLLIEDERKLCGNYKNKLNLANETIEGLSIENEELGKLIESIKAENYKLQSKSEYLEKCKNEIEQTLRTEITELESNLSRSEEEFQTALQKKQKSLQHSQSELNSLIEKIDLLEREINNEKDHANSSQKEINILKADLNTKNDIIYDTTTKNRELSTQIQSLAEAIEQEKLKHAKELTLQNQQSERKFHSFLQEAKALHEEEMRKQLQELEITNQRYLESLDYIKEKEEENSIINKDREKLQDMIRELDSKLRELVNQYQSESVTLDCIQSQLSEEKQLRISIENKYNLACSRIKDMESQYSDEIDKLNQIIKMNKLQLKEIKKQMHTEAEEKLQLAEDSVCFWKEKFREEVGYLEKWAESIEHDPNSSVNFSRISNMAVRLNSALEHTFL